MTDKRLILQESLGFSPLEGMQSEKALHRDEIPVRMQQGVTSLYTKSADEEIDCSAHRKPAAAQKTVIGRGFHGKLRFHQRDDFKFAQCLLDECCAQALKDLAEDEVANQQLLARN
jgi:hypothetical protein